MPGRRRGSDCWNGSSESGAKRSCCVVFVVVEFNWSTVATSGWLYRLYVISPKRAAGSSAACPLLGAEKESFSGRLVDALGSVLGWFCQKEAEENSDDGYSLEAL